jgi:hypothetical protein
MILLAHDCLFFELPNGDRIPLRTEAIAIEVAGDPPPGLDAEMVSHATAAVFHYFKHDLERLTVTVAEFTEALQQVLRRLACAWGGSAEGPVEWWGDLRRLAVETGGLELAFYNRLRAELRDGLTGTPKVLRFHGLRGCVKQLAGTRRWTHRCGALSDQIVDYLRRSLAVEAGDRPLALVVE